MPHWADENGSEQKNTQPKPNPMTDRERELLCRMARSGPVPDIPTDLRLRMIDRGLIQRYFSTQHGLPQFYLTPQSRLIVMQMISEWIPFVQWLRG